MVGPNDTVTEHQQNWWGTQKCRRCNPLGCEVLRPVVLRPNCPDCDGSGWTEWAALATEPWTEIIPRLYVGGHEYNEKVDGKWALVHLHEPSPNFDYVVSMFLYEDPVDLKMDHDTFLFQDSREFTKAVKVKAREAAWKTFQRYTEGDTVMTRCQAGLNRSSLVAGLTMILLGFSGEDAVQLIRSKRSPWALCNDKYASYLSSGRAEADLAADMVTA